MVVECPKCHKMLKARDGLLGKKVKCPACAHVFVMPHSQSVENIGVPEHSQTSRTDELIASLEDDIASGMDTDISGRSSKAALELSRIGEKAVGPLIRKLPQSGYAHLALGLIGGERAFQALCTELKTGDSRRITAAAKALGRIADPRALDILGPLTSARSADVSRAASTAIAQIKSAQAGTQFLSQVDRDNPVDQVGEVWDLLDKIPRDPALREKAIHWHGLFVAAMPELSFPSEQETAHVWSNLGVIIFYLQYPQASSISSHYGKSPEAAYCFEQCVKHNPDRARTSIPSDWEKLR